MHIIYISSRSTPTVFENVYVQGGGLNSFIIAILAIMYIIGKLCIYFLSSELARLIISKLTWST